MILLDSSLIIAYSNKADVNHEKALKIIRDLDKGKYGTPVITDYVFDEVITVMMLKTKNIEKVSELGEVLLNSTLLFRVDEDIYNSAWKIFKEQRKPRFSFTDCTSIAICKANGISNIATFDEDFKRIEGYNVIDK